MSDASNLDDIQFYFPTEVLHVDAHWPDMGAIAHASAVLHEGGLVAFPTETVYGLGANAFNSQAVKKIFASKGRPANNPLIVHIAHAKAALPLTQNWPESAQKLADRFWPGPLTLVLPKSELVPGEVTAGGSTVALRVPSHPVALALLETCELPLAAPSANRSASLSPTRGDHVLRSLEGRFDVLLDCGATPGGLESTVLDLTSATPRVLRPGLISRKEIEAIIGPVVGWETDPVSANSALPSPGMLPRHYAPHTPLEVVPGTGEDRVMELSQQGQKVGWITRESMGLASPAKVMKVVLPDDPAGYAKLLYAALHDLDEVHLDRIIVASPPPGDSWVAIQDRLRRAACL